MLDLALLHSPRGMTNHMSKDIEGDLDCDEPSVEGIRQEWAVPSSVGDWR